MDILKQIDHNTKLIGVIGHPIKHSYSPLMHNFEFRSKNLNYLYLPFDIPPSNLREALKGMIVLGIKGFNVTIPHKEKIIQYLDHVSDEAASVGAVNTIVNEGGLLHGYNTDIYGIVETLNPYKDEIYKNNVTIIGAGGAARAVIYTLIRHFRVEKIFVLNRTIEKVEALRDYFKDKMHFENIFTDELIPVDNIENIKSSNLIINTTPIGMYPNISETPIDISEVFNSNQMVFDLIYNPLKTEFLKIAEAKGATIINGLKMFVEQGAKAFELWTGQLMDTNKIYKELQKRLG